MNSGRIEVTTSKKGKKIYTLFFMNKRGEESPLPITNPDSFGFPDDYEGGECEFEPGDDGKPTLFKIDGKIYSLNPPKEKRKGNSKKHQTNKESISDSFNIKLCELPADTKKAMSTNNNEIENFYLRLNRFVNWKEDKKDKADYNIGKPIFDTTLINNVNNNMKNIEDAYQNSNYDFVSDIILKPDWRFVIGLGSASVYETSMTLHHIYGIPYIPASAVKGVLRSHVINEVFGKYRTDKDKDNKEDIAEIKAMEDDTFRSIFGGHYKDGDKEKSEAGKVIFFDAFPCGSPEIEIDIMNPHYGDYYSGEDNASPADYHSPKLINFLTVKNTGFKFMFAVRKTDNQEISSDELKTYNSNNNLSNENITACVKEWLIKTLSEHGIGSKTAVGYGYFHM